MRKLLVCFALGAVLFSFDNAKAWDQATNGKVALIIVETNEFYIRLENGPNLCSAAGDRTSVVFRVGLNGYTSDTFRAVHAQILAAKLAGRTIDVYAFNSSSGGCTGGPVNIN